MLNYRAAKRRVLATTNLDLSQLADIAASAWAVFSHISGLLNLVFTACGTQRLGKRTILGSGTPKVSVGEISGPVIISLLKWAFF